jgi:hypothetical protein
MRVIEPASAEVLFSGTLKREETFEPFTGSLPDSIGEQIHLAGEPCEGGHDRTTGIVLDDKL